MGLAGGMVGSSSVRTVRQHGEGLAGDIKASGARQLLWKGAAFKHLLREESVPA